MNVGFFEFNQSPWHLGVAFEIAQVELSNSNKVFFNFLAHDVTENNRNRYVSNYYRFNRYLYPEYKIARNLQEVYKRNFVFSDSIVHASDRKLYSDQLITDAKYAARMDLIDEIKGNIYDDFEYENIIEKKAFAYCKTYDSVLKFIEENKVTKVYTFNGRFLHERAVWSACTNAEIECIFHEKVDSIRGNTYTIFKTSVHSSTERSANINRFWEENAFSYSSKVDVAYDWLTKRQNGITQKFTKMQISKYSPKNDGSKTVLFLHSSNDELISSGLNNPTTWGDQYLTIRKVHRLIKQMTGLKLLIRMHPNLLSKNAIERSKWYKFVKEMNCEFIEPDSNYDTYQLIKDSLCVISYGSTAGIEATLLHKPSILVGPALHRELNATINIDNESDLKKLLHEIINNEINIDEYLQQAYKYAFYYSIAGNQFIHNKIIGDKELQDPLLEICGIDLKYNILFKSIYKLKAKLFLF